MCDFVSVLRSISDDGITETYNHGFGFIDTALETVEPYIVDELNLLKIKDLTNAYVGFTHP